MPHGKAPRWRRRLALLMHASILAASGAMVTPMGTGTGTSLCAHAAVLMALAANVAISMPLLLEDCMGHLLGAKIALTLGS